MFFLILGLSGCAGIATYQISPFYETNTKQVICCQATITNGKDISSLQVDVSEIAGNYTLHFTETGVGATAPVTAQGAVISNGFNAVGNVAADVLKFSLP